MSIRLYHHPGFAAPIGDHIMPIAKFALVAEELSRLPGFEIVEPPPATETDILRVHTPKYVVAIQSGFPRELAESQKFPWSPTLYPSVLLTNGGVIAAAQTAIEDGVSGALASGFHHSSADHGEGFCTFNGLVVALESLRLGDKIENAAILDLDLHYGNGTASLAATRPWLNALSIYGNDYADNVPYRKVDIRRHEDGLNHFSVPIPAKTEGPQLFELLEANLPWLLRDGRPDILLYQAGADPLRDDPYSPLNLTHEDLRERDRMVFAFAKSHGIPIAWVLAGGYTRDIHQVVQVHVNTGLACREIFGAPISR